MFFDGLDQILVRDFARVFIKSSCREDGKGLAIDLRTDQLINFPYK